NEPTQENLEEATPDKYFMESGANVKEFIEALEIIPPFKKNYLGNIIAAVFKKYQVTETSKMLDSMKELGYSVSTRSGITVGIADILVLTTKDAIIEKAHDKVEAVTKQFRRGLISDDERYNHVINAWNEAKDLIQSELMASLGQENPSFRMSDSGARGDICTGTQLPGRRGCMASPRGSIRELPVSSDVRDG